MDRREIDWYGTWNHRRDLEQGQHLQDRPDYDRRGEYQHPPHHPPRNDFDRFGQDYRRFERNHPAGPAPYQQSPGVSHPYQSHSRPDQDRFSQHYQSHFPPDPGHSRWGAPGHQPQGGRQGQGSSHYGDTFRREQAPRPQYRSRAWQPDPGYYARHQSEYGHREGYGPSPVHSGRSYPFYDAYSAQAGFYPEQGSTYARATYGRGQGLGAGPQEDSWNGPAYGTFFRDRHRQYEDDRRGYPPPRRGPSEY